jgi:BirA family biotin operon repressor/biotin-[acetyl-CoA-carboxylase] ligase
MGLLMLDEVDSTNTYAREHFDDLEDGTLVAARSQTAGRGRRERAWVSPPGVNFTGTMLFKRLTDGFHAGCLLGVAALALIRELAPELPVYLKWPNDLYIEDRKLAGILCESARIENGRITAVAAGIGINVNLSPEALQAIDQPATSLLAETKREFNLDFFSKKLAETANRYYIIYLNNTGTVIREWIAANLLTGESLTVIDPRGKAHTGIFRRILEDGSMLFEEKGVPIAFTCGDVKIDRDSVDWNRLKQKASNHYKQPEE